MDADGIVMAEQQLQQVARALVPFFPPRWLPEEGPPVEVAPPPAPGRRRHPRLPAVRLWPEDLLRPWGEILHLLLHGMVHYAHALMGVKDCSRGHYHNQNFQRLARRVGLRVEETDPRFGWARTEVEPRTLQRLVEIDAPEFPTAGSDCPSPLAERAWRCGLNLPDGTELESWQADTHPPGVPRYRLVLEREGELPLERFPRLCRESTAATLLWRLLRDYDREALAVLFLDNGQRLIGFSIPYVGTLSHAPAEPRGVLVPALLVNAAAVMVGHNHPSGDPMPSPEDEMLHDRLVRAGKILGVPVLASLVVAGPGRWRSIADPEPFSGIGSPFRQDPEAETTRGRR